MNPFEKFVYRWNFFVFPMEKVCGLIEDWVPKDCKSEKDFEESLYRWLKYNLSGIEIIKQYGLAENRIDISVGRKVFIEIKKDLINQNHLKRLVGQLTLYEKERIDYLILLICCQHEPNLVSQLEKEISKYNYHFPYNSVELILKK
jgi:hypothetical protein